MDGTEENIVKMMENPEGEQQVIIETPEAEKEIKQGEMQTAERKTEPSDKEMLQQINMKMDALLAANNISL